MSDRRVVVTGRGVVSPLGVGIEQHRGGLFGGRSVIRRSGRLASFGCELTRAGEIPEEALETWIRLIPPKQRKLMNRSGVLAAIASSFAANEAGLPLARLDPARVGVFLGTWFTAHDLPSVISYLAGTESKSVSHLMDQEKANVKWLKTMNPLDSLKLLPNLTAGHLAILHQAQGLSRVIADGWRGGLIAVAEAAYAIQDGEVDIALAGGSESPLEEGIFLELSTLDIIARDGEEPDRIFKPFDRSRQGTVLGEGAGVVTLEERDHALRRGATLYGEILGSASSAPGPDQAAGLRRSIEKALFESRLDPGGVGFIHANGDSTKDHDQAEGQAIQHVFGPYTQAVPVTATKSLHGHLLSASGAVELISCLLILEEGLIPPIFNCYHPDPECALDLVMGSPRGKPGMRSALLHAIGLFGEGASLVIQR